MVNILQSGTKKVRIISRKSVKTKEKMLKSLFTYRRTKNQIKYIKERSHLV